jgi:hypothetical protein
MRRRRETRAARFGKRRFEDVIFEASAGKTKDAEESKRRLAFHARAGFKVSLAFQIQQFQADGLTHRAR